MSNPVSPSLKNLPKVAVDLKSQLEGFDHKCMKKAATTEKNVLPSAKGISEKNCLFIKFENENLLKMKHFIGNKRCFNNQKMLLLKINVLFFI